jgi:polyisoprenoid-binding protein YceI
MATVQDARETVSLPAGTWTIDPAHSSIEFRIEEDIRTIKGRFIEFEGAIEGGEEPSARGVIRTASLETDEPRRNEHLKSPDFFEVERFPEIRFVSTGIERVEDGALVINGDLTIKDTTLQIPLRARLRGPQPDAYGRERIAIDSTGRLEWGPTAVLLTVDVTATRND